MFIAYRLFLMLFMFISFFIPFSFITYFLSLNCPFNCVFRFFDSEDFKSCLLLLHLFQVLFLCSFVFLFFAKLKIYGLK